ncbi:cupin domain-containing protein [Paraburkholderia rhizosphaerae]|uniref:Cupin 2 domain-containing protein n=1 Tax=Paraburkholderia rhizosphaerae TaxID=480658 RepID=A0A4R8LK68_9BURK|nr:cupin domain-containing protein [Paraburkholderia rhizosphaerae]TDY42730.1 cupin 2 domain-containing protein [Paraburkholderia rhizosphaerae]
MKLAPRFAPGAAGNLFSPVEHGPHEHVDVLAERGDLTIERIVSMAHASPAGFWYDSPRDEWVVLLTGAAALEFEHDAARHEMRAGDYLLIEAHRRHRVAWTHPDQPTVWLAVHYSAEVDKAPDDRR